MSREIKSPKAAVLSATSYDGKHTLEFNEGSHRYKLDGKPCVGVTTFTKAGYPTSMRLISWMKGQTAEAVFAALTVPDDRGYQPREGFWPVTEQIKADLLKAAKMADRGVTQEAADIGTITHGFAEFHSAGRFEDAEALLARVRRVTVWPLIDKCVKKYLSWVETNKGKLVLAESIIASPSHLFCGKFDRLDDVNGRLILRDYKTSKGIFTEHKIQLAAYRLAIKEWLNLDIAGIEILRFGKLDDEFETCLIDDPIVLRDLEEQVIRCRKTHEFIKTYDE